MYEVLCWIGIAAAAVVVLCFAAITCFIVYCCVITARANLEEKWRERKIKEAAMGMTMKAAVSMPKPWSPYLDPFETFNEMQHEWSEKTFGPSVEANRPKGYAGPLRGPAGPLKHLVRELLGELFNLNRVYVDSVIESIDANEEDWKLDDPEEYADLQFLVTDATRRKGIAYDELIALLFDKLRKNMERKWPPVSAAGAKDAVEHVRNESSPTVVLKGKDLPSYREAPMCENCNKPATEKCENCRKFYCPEHAEFHRTFSSVHMTKISVDGGGAAG